MLTYDECLAMSDLTECVIDAIAEHEHMDPMIAMALGQYLIEHEHQDDIKTFILEDIAKAQRCGDTVHIQSLMTALQHCMHHQTQSHAIRT